MFSFKGSDGQYGSANITIDFSANAKSVLNGGGTADAILTASEDMYRVFCTTYGEPASCQKSFQEDESISFQMNLNVGETYQVGLSVYSHADICGGSVYAFCNVTIHNIKIEFSGDKPPKGGTTNSFKQVLNQNRLY